MIDIPLIQAAGDVQLKIAKSGAAIKVANAASKPAAGAAKALGNKQKPANQHKVRTGPKASTEAPITINNISRTGSDIREQVAAMLTNQLAWAVKGAEAAGATSVDPIRDIDMPVAVAVTNLVERGYKPKSLQYAIRIARNIVNDFIAGNVDWLEMQNKILSSILPSELDEQNVEFNDDK
jgi:hypothetical protein